MTRPGFRVFVTTHHGGLVSAVLMRRYRLLFDPPPPAAIADTADAALARLAPQAALIAEDSDDAARYVWTETLEMRRVEVDIHPGRPDPRGYVITAASVPVRLGYAAAKLEGAPLYRVIVPRFDWSFVAEDLAAVPDTIRALVFSTLVGDNAASLYDLRREVAEDIVEWRPIDAPLHKQRRAASAPDPTPTLDAIAENWVAMAAAGRLPATVGIDPVFDTLAPALSERRIPSTLLVGPRGAGKTSIVRRVARALLERNRIKGSLQRRLWATTADRIVAGMVYLGMWQERCLKIVHELDGGADVLYVDRLADVLAPMADGAAIIDLLGPAVIAGGLTLVAECDEAELVRARQRVPALVDALRVVRVDEATPPQAIALLEPYGQRAEPPVALSPDAARRLVELLAAFRRDTALPGKALAFVDYLASRAPKRAEAPRLGIGELTDAFAAWSGLPVDLLSPDKSLDTAAIAGELRRGVVGQDHACATAARVIARLKAGLDDPQRPVGALLFAGPTGVGKTELAKQLARYLFSDAERLVRVDMSELVTGAAIARLITPSPRRHVARRPDPPPAAVGRAVRRDREGGRRRVRPAARRDRRGPADRRARPARRLPHGGHRDDDEPRRGRPGAARVLLELRHRPGRGARLERRDPPLLPSRAARPRRRDRAVPAAAAAGARAHRRPRARQAARATRARRAPASGSRSPPRRARGSRGSGTIRGSARARYGVRSRISWSVRWPTGCREIRRGAR